MDELLSGEYWKAGGRMIHISIKCERLQYGGLEQDRIGLGFIPVGILLCRPNI